MNIPWQQQSLPPTFRITMFQLMETGTYNDMYRRPYKTQLTPHTLAAFQEATSGGANVNANTVAGVAGDILRPASQVEAMVDIPNGWGEKRFLFMMEVQHNPSGFTNHTGVRQLISGSTDYVGASNLSGLKVHIDEQLKLFINSIVTIRSVEMMGPTGTYIQENIVDASQILAGSYQPENQGFGQGFPASAAGPTCSMRPSDIFNTNQMEMFRDAPTLDTRTSFAFGVKKSLRSNNLAPTYVSKVVSAYQQSLAQGEAIDNHAGLMSRAAGIVPDPAIARDAFFKLLSDSTRITQRGYVTYAELCRMQPDLDSITDVRYQDTRSLIQAHQRGQTENWTGANLESVMATVLFQSIPAIMVALMLVRTTLVVHNRTTTGEFDIKPAELLGFQRMPVDERLFNVFANRLRTEVLRDLSRNNMIDIAFTITVDVTGESQLSLSVDGHPAVPFAVPSFCDSRFVPVMTNNFQTLEHMAADMAQLCQNTSVDMTRMDPGYAQGDAVGMTPGYTQFTGRPDHGFIAQQVMPVAQQLHSADAPPGYGVSAPAGAPLPQRNYMNEV